MSSRGGFYEQSFIHINNIYKPALTQATFTLQDNACECSNRVMEFGLWLLTAIYYICSIELRQKSSIDRHQQTKLRKNLCNPSDKVT